MLVWVAKNKINLILSLKNLGFKSTVIPLLKVILYYKYESKIIYESIMHTFIFTYLLYILTNAYININYKI